MKTITLDDSELTELEEYYRSVKPEKTTKVIVDVKGGKGSGHFGHSGRPGKVGGSAPKVNITGSYKNWDFALFKQRGAEMVSVDTLYEMKEWDRALRAIAMTDITGLANDIVMNGLTDSLIIDYSVVNHVAFVTEGNHRIAALRQLGVSHAPARIVTTKRSPNEKGIVVSGIKPDWSGYVPSTPTPSQIGLDAIPIDEFVSMLEPKTTKVIVDVKGGKGSGHFGHSGRPGKVGGSLSGKVSIFHATQSEGTAKRIIQEGLKIGKEHGEGPPGVYFTAYRETALFYGRALIDKIHSIPMDMDYQYAVVEFELPKDVVVHDDVYDQEHFFGGPKKEQMVFYLTENVPAEFIKHVWLYKYTGTRSDFGVPGAYWVEEQLKERVGFAVVIIKPNVE